MATNRVNIQIPKVIIKSGILSVLAAVVAALIFNEILIYIPISPEHTQNEFVSINHGNPMVYATEKMHEVMASENEIDSVIVTPITLLIAGVVFCMLLPYSTWPMRRAMKSALIAGASISVLILMAGYGFTVIAQELEGIQPSPINLTKLPVAAVQIALYTVVFMLGAWPAAALRKKTLPVERTPAGKSPRKQAA